MWGGIADPVASLHRLAGESGGAQLQITTICVVCAQYLANGVGQRPAFGGSDCLTRRSPLPIAVMPEAPPEEQPRLLRLAEIRRLRKINAALPSRPTILKSIVDRVAQA